MKNADYSGLSINSSSSVSVCICSIKYNEIGIYVSNVCSLLVYGDFDDETKKTDITNNENFGIRAVHNARVSLRGYCTITGNTLMNISCGHGANCVDSCLNAINNVYPDCNVDYGGTSGYPPFYTGNKPNYYGSYVIKTL